ncbi:MAG: glutamate dehydrogenase [Polaribacter sp.]|uniref:glutamate dehydrogenase n=1 Tax=Polaribacter sp. TaxID=1920175 RepID=UPI003263A1F8
MILVFLLGFIFSFLGYTLPSVLNMTSLKIKLKGEEKEFIQFILGASFIVFLQAYISIYLTAYISNNPAFLQFLEKTGIFVLFFLSIYFYQLNKKEKKQIVINNKNSFFKGLILSILNVFAIPYFSGVIIFLVSFNLMNFNYISTLFFVFGAMIGAFLILYLYGRFAFIIQQKTGNLTNNINLILCFITAGFGLFTLFKFVI